MKLNRSLGISHSIQELRTGDIISVLENEFPRDVLERNSGDGNTRNRIFTPNNTLLTMVFTATQEDKTLKNSVDLFYMFHQKHYKQALLELEELAQLEKDLDQKKAKTAGRPKKYTVKIPKSLESDISLNTAAYSKARERVPLQMTMDLFRATRIEDAKNDYSHWHGYRVFISDGTYVQMQDSKSIRQDYEVKYNGEGIAGYPQGLLEVLMERGTGQIHDFRLSNRHVSELALFYQMMDGLPSKSMLLLDALYNCFEIIAKCARLDIAFVVPCKSKRNYELLEVIEEGDEIIRIKTPKNRAKWLDNNEKAATITLRQITCTSPDGKVYVLHTNVLDKKIKKEEFQMVYLTRWDVEVGIREVKTIMDTNILRSKTPEMALKELTVSLATYNLIRKVLYASIKDLPFSPKEDFIFKFYTYNKDLLIDKKGRVYNRWSSGRRRIDSDNTETDTPETKTK